MVKSQATSMPTAFSPRVLRQSAGNASAQVSSYILMLEDGPSLGQADAADRCHDASAEAPYSQAWYTVVPAARVEHHHRFSGVVTTANWTSLRFALADP